MSDIKEFLAEFMNKTNNVDTETPNPNDFGKKINQNPTSVDKNDARSIVQKMRGIPVGKRFDLNADRPLNIAQSEPKSLSLLLKNDTNELVYLTETEHGDLVFTSISKRLLVKRDTIILQRHVQFLKRYLVQV